MKILWLGSDLWGSKQRADACIRLGHELTLLDPRHLLPSSPWVDRWIWNVGGKLFEARVRHLILQQIERQHFDLCIVDQGELIGARTVAALKRYCGSVISYINDDPFGRRDRRRFQQYLRALPHYDISVVVREVNMAEAYACGARHVFLTYLASDDVEHAPLPLTDTDRQRWSSEVLFIGTWMEERGPFMAALLEAGLPLTIYGNRWQKSPQWPRLKSAWRGNAVYGDDYAKAIQCARVNLGLLSKGNRDSWTTRSAEIPALGGLLCAERTDLHRHFYAEDHEAVFWRDADECIAKCRGLLADDARRRHMAALGQQRARRNALTNENTMEEIIGLANVSGSLPDRSRFGEPHDG
jgi:spore maturation protein CgeB